MTDQETKEEPSYALSNDPQFRTAYVTGAYGGLDPNGGQIVFYLDNFEPRVEEKTGVMNIGRIRRNQIIDIRMSPHQFISIAEWMMSHAEAYKKQMQNEKLP
ncbi:MAG: hypothetical protein PHP59_08150 [Methanofollis sp.]|jgi:hypothetical protein|uniref:hypothetical protein n=1 Tax=unclassified Methanofollis TaxID=2634179 RepID=UPI0026356666|nr:hypothetical protein [Methanofollis sp.]MDD4255331.1 hypothetical protein [Methanofollis sp.]